jgi:glycine cleavage system H lipoate-binding protein
MIEFLETTVDKFTFKVATDRFYSKDGVWAKEGTVLVITEELAVIETIKVNISYSSPVSGKIMEVNTAMTDCPEVINQDPYGTGWMVTMEVEEWESQRATMLTPQVYFEIMKSQAEKEARKA